MTAKQASRNCAKCKKPYDPSTEAEPSYMVSTTSDLLCPKCKRKHSAQIVNTALRNNVEKMCVLAGHRK